MPQSTYYEGSTDTAIRIGHSPTDYLHVESQPEGGARVHIRYRDQMLAFDLTEFGRQFLAGWLAPQLSQRLAELQKQLDAAGDYAGYYAAAYDNYHATGKGHILSFDDWWQTPHCPMCGRVELDRGTGEDGAERWECNEVDGCGHSWPVEPPPTHP
jgi:hypothetical protein